MSQKHIELYKIRDFSAKMNATIEYLRQNIGGLVKTVLLIVCPFGLVSGILFSRFYAGLPFQAGSTGGNPEDVNLFLQNLGTNYMLLIIVFGITYSFLFTSVYYYIKLKEELGRKPEVMEVYNKILPIIPSVLLLMFLTTFVTIIGTAFFILPGIYLGVALSLALPILLFEEVGVGTAFSKSFQLIKGKWWSTFGLIIVSTFIAGMASYVFAIPFYAFFIGSMFTVAETQNPEAVFNIFSSWYFVVGMSIMMIGSYLTYIIPILALAFQYFNLSERVEGRGLRNIIDEFETVA